MNLLALATGTAGLVVGVAVTWLWTTARRAGHTSALEEEVTRLRTRLEERTSRLTDLETEAEQIPELVARAARLEAEVEAERRAGGERSALLAGGESAFRAAAEETLGRMERSLAEVERARAVSAATLTAQLESMADTHRELRTETGSLARALSAPGARGRWGEMQLRRVVELAGMVERCDFQEQVRSEGEDGALRPDLIVHLPGGRHVIVDAKAPGADGAPEDASQARLLRDHMTRLGSKRYWSQFDATPEFVVMFLPGESAFARALEADPDLLDHGVGHRVLPASPTTLIALLRAVAHGWQEDRLAANVTEIGAAGRELYQRLLVLGKHVAGVGRGLGRAVAEYNRTVETLETRVYPGAQRLRRLGAGTEDAVPGVAALSTDPRQASNAPHADHAVE